MSLVNSTRRARNLSSFSMHAEWELSYLEALLEASPDITNLTVEGQLAHRYSQYHDLDSPHYSARGQILKNYTATLSHFPNLAHLHLPYSSDLDLGFYGGHWCGNAYFGPDGREYGRSVSRADAETTEFAADIVLPRLPHLRSLSIGGLEANITRNEEGLAINATWPWAGRTTEWTYEVWPETGENEG